MNSVINCLTAPVQSLFPEVLSAAMGCEENLELLAEEMSRLTAKRDAIKGSIITAQGKGMVPTPEVQSWLERVTHVEDAADKIKDEFDNRVHCFGDLSLRCQLNQRAKNVAEDARDLNNRSFTQTAVKAAPAERPVRASLVGRDSEMKQLQDLVNDDTVRTIGIYGMGGVGKTSLMEEFNYYCLPRDAYDAVVWIDMDDRPSVMETQKAVSKKLKLRLEDGWTVEERAIRIFDRLSRKRFVLVLENVWKPTDLGAVGIPIAGGQPKSKIIVMTRKEDVCDIVGAKKIKLGCLELEDSWRLFVEKTGKEELINSNPMIRRQAKKLVHQCGGLPLALVTLGRAVATKRTPQQWKHIIGALEAAPAQIPRFQEDVLSRLKLSCDDLADDKLMTVLMYCAMIQSGAPVKKETVINYCIGEGTIEGDFSDGKELYNKGHHLLGALRAASLLEDYYSDDRYMCMHPMVRIMALWIGCECGKERRWLIQVGRGLKLTPDIRRWRGVERISFCSNNIRELPETPDCPWLLTLFLAINPELATIPDGFLASMRNLRVLDLSWTSITELPAGISVLDKLQYFDVRGTPIRSLPKELGALDKLKFALLSDTPHLKTIPSGVISNFSRLQVLRMENSYAGWKVGSGRDGVDFQELNCLEQLTTLELTVGSQGALEKLAASHRLAASTRRVYVKGCPRLAILLASALTRDMKSLQRLQICDSSDLEEFVIDNNTGDELVLADLSKAKLAWGGGCLQSLRELRIWRCSGIEQLIHSKHEEADAQEEGLNGEINVFPSLETLELQDLPELKSLDCGRRGLAFPSLESLRVNNCPELKIPQLSAEKLKRIEGPKSWWDGQHENTKSKLLHLYKEWP